LDGTPVSGERGKIDVVGVTHTYAGESGVTAVENISLRIGDGEFYVIIGPSGCGKTTLLRIVAGLVAPTRGAVYLDGREIHGPDPERGVVFQSDAVFPWMTVRDNVEFGPRCRGVDRRRREELVEKYIDLVGLRGFENAVPKELSGGMRKRVDLARVYANNPEVLIMDEPFGSLDAYTRDVMQEELSKLWSREKKTVFFITHDIEEAIFLGDTVVLMTPRPGKIAQTVRVPFGHPRPHQLKTADEFVRIRAQLTELIRSVRQ
jgi:NitT/TauT family transport system ATP-binding protein